MIFRFALLFTLLSVWQTTLYAQNTFSSPYSVYGVGMMNERSSSLSRSLAGTGIAVQDEQNINPVNPASYGSIQSPVTHIHEIGMYVESNRYITKSINESKTNGGISNLNYFFKFAPWWSASAGLTPFSTVAYKIKTVRELATNSTVNYTYEGSGNINQIYLGNALNVVKNLSLGFNASYLFGSILKSESLDLSDGESYLTYQNKIVARQFHLDFGMQYKINMKKKALIIGAIADRGISFTGTQHYVLYNQNADTLSNTAGKSVHYKLPGSMGMGLSLQSKRYMLATDLKYENWSKAQYANEEVIFRNTWKLSAGYLYKGKPDATRYFELISMRAGFHLQQSPFVVKGTRSPIWGASAGLSLPMFDGKSALNLVYSFDQFGTLENKLILQRSHKIMLDIVIRDLWGAKRKFE